jgi:hypothetical protein
MHFARWFKAPNASLTVSVDFALAIQEDTQIRVKVINLSSGNTIFNKTTKLTFANKSHTFSWNVSENIPTPFRITVTNLSNSKIPPTLFMVVK